MSDFTFSTEPPANWSALCVDSGALFGSAEWQRVLHQGFNCRSLYFSRASGGFVVSVFRGGPFEIGYLGFPAGGIVGRPGTDIDLAAIMKSNASRAMPMCVRVPVREVDQYFQIGQPFVVNPETVIDNLQDWDLASVSKSLRRDVRRAQRTDLSIQPSANMADGQRLFEIYSSTVKRQGGSLRYSAGYFRSLVDLSTTNPRLRVVLARRGQDIAGFVVIGCHADTAYYLHGGAAAEYRKESPSDLLLSDSIEHAKQAGYRQFSLMASPSDQPSLVRYKEKWGGVTRDLRTATVVLRPSYHLFRFAETLLARMR